MRPHENLDARKRQLISSLKFTKVLGKFPERGEVRFNLTGKTSSSFCAGEFGRGRRQNITERVRAFHIECARLS
ncbi:MAG: hypothetical protein QOE77_799 [Blastocatellia bacterium]|jgi:hypothetical protein|nr:hypothetical protein [Blastocatellia bacterium]